MGNRQRPIDGIHVVELGVICKAGVRAVVLSRSHLGADAEIVKEDDVASIRCEKTAETRCLIGGVGVERVDRADGRIRGGASGKIRAGSLSAGDPHAS